MALQAAGVPVTAPVAAIQSAANGNAHGTASGRCKTTAASVIIGEALVGTKQYGWVIVGAGALVLLGAERAWVVHGADGIDEIPLRKDNWFTRTEVGGDDSGSRAAALYTLIETAKLVDDLTDTRSHKGRESWALGVANIVVRARRAGTKQVKGRGRCRNGAYSTPNPRRRKARRARGLQYAG